MRVRGIDSKITIPSSDTLPLSPLFCRPAHSPPSHSHTYTYTHFLNVAAISRCVVHLPLLHHVRAFKCVCACAAAYVRVCVCPRACVLGRVRESVKCIGPFAAASERAGVGASLASAGAAAAWIFRCRSGFTVIPCFVFYPNPSLHYLGVHLIGTFLQHNAFANNVFANTLFYYLLE